MPVIYDNRLRKLEARANPPGLHIFERHVDSPVIDYAERQDVKEGDMVIELVRFSGSTTTATEETQA
jgi:hypothetical protein